MSKRILTWLVNPAYFHYLTQVPYDWYVISHGSSAQFSRGKNVHPVDPDEVSSLDLDCIVYQSRENYETDRHLLLSPSQRRLPAYYLEHHLPVEYPANTQHFVGDSTTIIIHTAYFNQLMWDTGRQPTIVIEHGVNLPKTPSYQGDWERGVVITTYIQGFGRQLGIDLVNHIKQYIPLDVIGQNTRAVDGLGEVTPAALPQILTRYRFVFNPARFHSLDINLVESMSLGLPLVSLATTEVADIIQHGVHGFLSTNISVLIHHMRHLLTHPAEAALLSEKMKYMAAARFGLDRFINDWQTLLEHPVSMTTSLHRHQPPIVSIIDR